MLATVTALLSYTLLTPTPRVPRARVVAAAAPDEPSAIVDKQLSDENLITFAGTCLPPSLV